MNWNSAELICCDVPAALAEHGVRDVVFAVGTFDGLHRGHLAVIRAMLEESRRLNATPAVLTFCPHPRAVLTPEQLSTLKAEMNIKGPRRQRPAKGAKPAAEAK